MSLTEEQHDIIAGMLLQLEGDEGRKEIAGVYNFWGSIAPDVGGAPDGVYRLDTSEWQHQVSGGVIVKAVRKDMKAFWSDEEIVITATKGEIDEQEDDDDGAAAPSLPSTADDSGGVTKGPTGKG